MHSDAAGRASLTVEAAFALPFFFLCLTALICMLDVYALFAQKTVQLQQTAEKTAVAAAAGGELFSSRDHTGSAAGSTGGEGSGSAGGGTVIDLPELMTFRPEGFPFQVVSIRVPVRGRVHPWVGYTGGGAEDTDDPDAHLVYVTDYESVYHTFSDCTHLDLSWEAVSSSEAGRAYNVYGAHYHACEKCIGSGAANGTVYISPRGDRYHNSATCSGLTRHVHLVKTSEVSGLHQCSRCAVREAGG